MGKALASDFEACMDPTVPESSRTANGLPAAEMGGSRETQAAGPAAPITPDQTSTAPEQAELSEPVGPVPITEASLLDSMRPIIEKTVNALIKKRFPSDPIAGRYYSQIVSVMSSAYKRHGYILETAILNHLRRCTRFEVWREPVFEVSTNADLLATGSLKDPFSILGNQINYESGPRQLQLDVLVYDKAAKTLKAYEVKRGFGSHDAGKRRQILRDTLCVSVLLRSYGISKGLDVSDSAAHVIFYYGKKSISAPFAIAGSELDAHFNWPVHAAVEEVNGLFKRRLHEMLSA
jgi:hypothetical protein